MGNTLDPKMMNDEPVHLSVGSGPSTPLRYKQLRLECGVEYKTSVPTCDAYLVHWEYPATEHDVIDDFV